MRPIVRYHGGKWKLADWIISHFPHHRIYTETFGGGGSVLLKKPRCYAEVYNDLDGEMVNLFRVARDLGESLKALLELTPFSREEFLLAYEPSDDRLEQARRTVVRAFMGYGSSAVSSARKVNSKFSKPSTGFRANSNRSGTTPAHDWRNYPAAFPELIERLRGIVIENRDALEVMEAHDGPTTLHYVDPPYVKSTRDAGNDYRFEMSDDDHVKLANFLRTLKGNVVVSGYPSPLYDELFKGWRVEEKTGSLADGGAKRTERLWLNFAHNRLL